mmetsp:Transcript_12148/g.10774  ORF Transcript_12148/g.10774 Transcript_12148/m.10774 type:complete len:101 (+) Transcript_12148:289-591(+)
MFIEARKKKSRDITRIKPLPKTDFNFDKRVYYDSSIKKEQLHRFMKLNKKVDKQINKEAKRARSNLKPKEYYTKGWGIKDQRRIKMQNQVRELENEIFRG